MKPGHKVMLYFLMIAFDVFGVAFPVAARWLALADIRSAIPPSICGTSRQFGMCVVNAR